MTDRFALLNAPARWQTVDLVSDLHLQAGEPETAAVWADYLQCPPQDRADALFILGDLFEVWIGDDVIAAPAGPSTELAELAESCAFLRACARQLSHRSALGPVYFLHGNRDFLLGAQALQASGMQALSDPTVLVFAGQRWLLSHGDALCLEDTEYQRFRRLVRSAEWQADFLARPLAERHAMAQEMRARSQAHKQSVAHDPALWADVDSDAATRWLQDAGATTLIHGHTHRPACHALPAARQRVVLSDWDVSARPPRAEVLRLSRSGIARRPLCV